VVGNDVAGVQAILSAGEDPNKRAKDGITPLMLACGILFDVAFTKKFGEGTGFEHRFLVLLQFRAAAAVFCTAEKRAIVELLLNSGANPNLQSGPLDDCNGGSYTTTALHLCAAMGNCDSMQLLLKNNAHLNALPENCGTPLHAATFYGQVQAIKLLIRAGANLESRMDEDLAPLHVAVYYGNLEVVKELLKAGE